MGCYTEEPNRSGAKPPRVGRSETEVSVMAEIIQLSQFRKPTEAAPQTRPAPRKAARKAATRKTAPKRAAPAPHTDPLQESFNQLRRHLDRIETSRSVVDEERERVFALAREAEQVLRWIEQGDVAA